MIGVRFRCQRKFNAQSGSGAVLALQSAAQCFNAFPHAAQAVSFDRAATPAIILDFDPAISVDRHQPQMAIASMRVANHVGHGFPHH